MRNTTFDMIADFYPPLEQIVFGSTLERARRFFARQIAEGDKVLLIGEGNGRFLFEIARQTSSASFTVVDSSARMLAAVRRRIATVDRCPRIELVHSDISEWRSPTAHYDRVVTHFFLDLFEPDTICRIVAKISRLATEDALWINVDFTSRNQGLPQKALLWMQYRFFRIFSGIEASRLFDPLPYLEQAGWQVLQARSLKSDWINAHLMCRRPERFYRRFCGAAGEIKISSLSPTFSSSPDRDPH